MQIKTVKLLNTNQPLNIWGRVNLLIKLLRDRDMLPSTASIHYVTGNGEYDYYSVCGVNCGLNESHIVNMVLRMSEEFKRLGYIESFY